MFPAKPPALYVFVTKTLVLLTSLLMELASPYILPTKPPAVCVRLVTVPPVTVQPVTDALFFKVAVNPPA